MKHFKRMLKISLAAFFYLAFAWNIRLFFSELVWKKFMSGMENRKNGRPFLDGDRDENYPWLGEMVKVIPAGSRVFCWSDMTGKAGVFFREMDAMKMNYYLHPADIFYADNTIMPDADFIVCRSEEAELLGGRLEQNGLGKIFRKVSGDENAKCGYVLFRRGQVSEANVTKISPRPHKTEVLNSNGNRLILAPLVSEETEAGNTR